MKARLATLAAALLLALSTAPAVHAQGIHERLEKMEKRIEHGRRTGELTRQEAEKLREELREIRQRERRMRNDDGRLSRREREALDADIDRLQRHIFRETHDDQKRRPR